MHIAKLIYEEKRKEYRQTQESPANDMPLKPYPVSFNMDMGERRSNIAFRERMHDIPFVEEAKALKVYIIAAEMERYYEGNIIHFQCHFQCTE